MKRKRYDEAVVHFRAANQLIPHPLTSFNLGFAYAKQSQWLESRAALTTYLQASPSDAKKLAEARLLFREVSSRVSVVQVTTTPPGASVRIGDEQLTSPGEIAILPGRYQLQIALAGYESVTRSLDLAAGETPVDAELDAIVIPMGGIQLTCNIPSVEVRLNDEPLPYVGAVFQRPVGEYVVRFSRPGYRTSMHTLRVTEGGTATALCEMPWDDGPDPAGMGRIEVTSSLGGRLKVDGKSMPMRVSVPVGPHTLTVEKPGYRTWQGEVQVDSQGTTTVTVELEAIAQVKPREANGTPVWAWVTGIGGLAAAAAGTGFYLTADAEFGNWRRQQDDLDELWLGATPRELAAVSTLQTNNDARAATVNTFDGVAIGCFVGAGVLLATSTVLWIVNSDDAPPDAVSLGPGGAAVQFHF